MTSLSSLQKEIISRMEEVMGTFPLPKQKPALNLTVLSEDIYQGCIRKKISFSTENKARDPLGLCEIRAWLLIPQGSKNPFPGMLALHQTSYAGKDHTIGIKTPYESDTADLSYALDLARRGYVTLSPDYPGFGEALPLAYGLGYLSMTMKALWNHHLALDVLSTVPEVDPERLGVIGHSLGGHNALFLATFDLRLKAVVCSCGFTSMAKLNGGNIYGWSHDRYMPRIGTHFKNCAEKIPFDFDDILAGIAPRPIFINAPLNDGFDLTGIKESAERARAATPLYGVQSSIDILHPNAGHEFPPEAKKIIYEKLDSVLI